MQMTLSPGATSLQQRRAARGDAGVDRSGDPLGFGGVEGPRHVEIARDFEGVPDERAAFFIYEGSGLATSRDCRVSMQGMGGARGRGRSGAVGQYKKEGDSKKRRKENNNGKGLKLHELVSFWELPVLPGNFPVTSR